MTKLLVYTDIHITEGGADIIGLGPADRFSQGLAHGLARHPDAAGILIAGDLTHHGTPGEYQVLKSLLVDCPLPVHLMIGNHDTRAAFAQSFPTSVAPDGFVHKTLKFGRHRVICLDSHDDQIPRTHAGILCAARLDWLNTQLEDAAADMVTLVSHHPAFDTGFTGMDRIKLQNGTAFLDLIGRHPCVKQLIHGHIHRTIMGHIRGLPVALLKSTCHQMPMALGQTSSGLSIDEPGAYGILLLGADQILLMPEDFTLPANQITNDPASL